MKTAAFYVSMLVATFGIWLAICHFGATLPAGLPAPVAAVAATATESVLARVLLTLAIVTLCARLVGATLHRLIRQPPVMGEILAGILLGPSALGAIWPAAQTVVLPANVAPYIGNIASVGVVLFMFLVGLELDPAMLRRGHVTVAISHASIVVPFVLGSFLALGLYPMYATADVGFPTFALFTGVAMSVTAFPVLARILTDRRVQRTPLGVTALACAAVDDVTAWCLLAVVVAVARAQLDMLWWSLLGVVVYIAAMFLLVRPAMRRLAAWTEASDEPLSRTALTVVLVALLFSALTTELIGIHALFGAFFLGALMPHEGKLATSLREKTEDFVVVLMLPAFFAFTGMRTQLSLVSTLGDWAVCGLIIALATVGKLGGTWVAARLTGMGHREAAALGALMNTRGLMQLVVLNLGLDLGVITPTVFAMMIVMALVTTFSTSPLLDAILGARGFATADLPDRAVPR